MSELIQTGIIAWVGNLSFDCNRLNEQLHVLLRYMSESSFIVLKQQKSVDIPMDSLCFGFYG